MVDLRISAERQVLLANTATATDPVITAPRCTPKPVPGPRYPSDPMAVAVDTTPRAGYDISPTPARTQGSAQVQVVHHRVEGPPGARSSIAISGHNRPASRQTSRAESA